jgi:hypothetical protein
MRRPEAAEAGRSDDVDPTPSTADWDRLTLARGKQAAFATDVYFRESWVDLVDMLGDEPAQLLEPLALLSFKPDGVVGRRMTPTLEFLLGRGFVPVALARVRLNRHSMRALWRYNWDVYPADRLALATLMHSSADGLVLLLRDTAAAGVPGSVRLSALKGPAAPEQRVEGQLREALRPPNAVVNFVHVADEPADLVRELGIFLARAERRERLALLRQRLEGDVTAEVRKAIADLERTYPAHDFDFERTVARLELARPGPARVGDELRRAAADGPKLRWDALRELLGEPGEGVDVWDFVCVASSVLVEERPGTPELLPSAGLEEWRAARG